jgi:hypothetical protein
MQDAIEARVYFPRLKIAADEHHSQETYWPGLLPALFYGSLKDGDHEADI